MSNSKSRYTEKELKDAQVIALVKGEPVLILNSIPHKQGIADNSSTKKE